MGQFIAKHADAIEGPLSCFDRLIFRGYLPFFSGYAMAAFRESKQVHRWELKRFLIEQAERVKTHARRMAEAAGRPCEYLPGARDKDALARAMATRDGIEQGLVCIYSVVEPCRTFSLRWQERHYVQSAKRKCLFLYYYFDAITVPKTPAAGRPVKAFNPIARVDSQLFGVLMSGEHALHGFTNRDLRDTLRSTLVRLSDNPKTPSAQVSRLLRRLHVYGLVAKIPRSRRWRVSASGSAS